jgi:PAS domain S-box-containing protein
MAAEKDPWKRVEYIGRVHLNRFPELRLKGTNDLSPTPKALLKSDELYRLLVDGLRIISWEADVKTRQFTFVSRQAEDILGYPLEEWLKPGFWDSHIHSDERIFTANFSKMFAMKGQDHDLEYRFQSADGATLWFHDIVSVIKKDGEPYALCGAMVNITDRKMMEETLNKAKEQAEDATALKDKFVSLVAHDLKSPLISVVGLLTLMSRQLDKTLEPKHREMFAHIQKSGDRMIKMIDELLDISRLQTGAIKPQPRFMDCHTAIDECVASLVFIAKEKGVKLANETPLGQRLYADPELFRRVMMNLLSNAIKFSHSGSTTAVFVPPGMKSVIAVKDQGMGISESLIPNLFRSDIKTSTIGTAGERGTGLGLPYCADILKAHGGAISVKSEPGKGSVFMAEFPHKMPLIMLVEDEQIARAVCKSHLDKVESEIVEAINGKIALEFLETRVPDLMILDLFMPEMGGFEVLGKLRSEPKWKNIPVIVVTADASVDTRDKAFRMGANDFATKPVNPTDFIPRVRRFLI